MSEPSEPTKIRLARELRLSAGDDPAHAAEYEAFAARAETGEFDDYADTYVCPITQLHAELMAHGFTEFAARVAEGEFDASPEESEAWAKTPAGQEAEAMLQSFLPPGWRNPLKTGS